MPFHLCVGLSAGVVSHPVTRLVKKEIIGQNMKGAKPDIFQLPFENKPLRDIENLKNPLHKRCIH